MPATRTVDWGSEIEFSITNFFGVMSILIGFVCLLLSGFLIVVPSPRKLPNLFLAAFLGLTAVEVTIWIWGFSGYERTWRTALWYALGKLQMPAFFFFFLSTCYTDFRLKLHDALHLVPFVLGLVSNWPGAPDLGPLGRLFSFDTQQSALATHLVYAGYMGAIVALLWRFRTRYRMHYSAGRSDVLVWLIQLAAASLFARFIIVVRDVLSFTSTSPVIVILQVFGALLALTITSWIALKSLLQPQLFRAIDRRFLELASSRPDLTALDLARVKNHVEIEKPYLNPDLTLAALSEQLAMTPREVSELLNQSLGFHFFDFINGHRIEHAKSLLTAYPKRSILQILHESGFNSKSSFNTAFKKHVGMTPSAYRSKMIL